MVNNTTEQKTNLRKYFSHIRKQIALDTNHAYKSDLLLTGLKKYLSGINFNNILFYYPLVGEVPILPVAQYYFNQKTVLFPRVDNPTLKIMVAVSPNTMDSFSTGFGGISEPIGKIFEGKIDVAIVPGLAFCVARNEAKGYYRLGFGGGFYDRFLQRHVHTLKLGLFYECTKSTHDFHMAHDIALEVIISEEKMYD